MAEIRILTPDDWALWRQLRLAGLAEAPSVFGSRLADWQGEGDREERWRARLGIPGARNVVAVLAGRPAGMASGVPAADGCGAELISMWVAPHARGHGVGDQLIKAVESWARQVGAPALRLAVRPGNSHAIALYERHGFTDTGQSVELMPDGVHRERVMEKKLS
ncbi:MAG TPA: GNAT family N-acetyltransferase [Streptosporangiaceae bacterium]|nr:GNAT family N-acetyltransferase [Streptosporangiaceae bacterium]